MKIKVYYSGIIRKSWKWKLTGANNRTLASARGFNSKLLALESVNLIIGNIKSGNYEVIAM